MIDSSRCSCCSSARFQRGAFSTLPAFDEVGNGDAHKPASWRRRLKAWRRSAWPDEYRYHLRGLLDANRQRRGSRHLGTRYREGR